MKWKNGAIWSTVVQTSVPSFFCSVRLLLPAVGRVLSNCEKVTKGNAKYIIQDALAWSFRLVLVLAHGLRISTLYLLLVMQAKYFKLTKHFKMYTALLHVVCLVKIIFKKSIRSSVCLCIPRRGIIYYIIAKQNV